LILGKPDVALGQTIQYVLESPNGVLERPDQASVDEIPGGKRGAGQRYSLTVDGCIDNHAGAIEHRPLRGVGILNSRDLEPFRPCLAVVEVEQRKFQDIRRLGQAVAACHELGTAHRGARG